MKNEFEKRGIIVFNNADVEISDYCKCNADEDSEIQLFEYKHQELLCNKKEAVFEKLVNDWIDWELLDFNFSIGAWKAASRYLNLFGIYFRNMAFNA